MTPSLYLRPDARTFDGTGGTGESAEFLSPGLLQFPWSLDVGTVALTNGALFFLADAEFPLADNSIPTEVWDIFNVQEWRISGTFTDASYTAELDRPDLSQSLSYVFYAGNYYFNGFNPSTNLPDSNSTGTAWTSTSAAIRGNGNIADSLGSLASVGTRRMTQISHVDESDETVYYYNEIRVAVGRPVLFKPTTGYIPIGSTVNQWGWCLPVYSSTSGGDIFAISDAAGGDCFTISFNGVEEGDLTSGSGNWSGVELSIESYFDE